MHNLSKKPGERAQNARLLARDLMAAARHSGLFPEEIVQSTLFPPGAVKLASRERTRAHELSADLAAKIGAAAAAAGPEPGAGVRAAPTLASPTADLHEDVASGELIPETNKPEPSPFPAGISASTLPRAIAMGGDPPYPLPRAISSLPAADLTGGETRPGEDLGDGGPASTLPGAPLGADVPQTSTIQGTETTLHGLSSGRPRRARVARMAVILACALAGAPMVILGGKKLGAFGAAATPADSLEATLEEARETMRRRAWDAPAGHNFKELTDLAQARWPGSTALADLRREAALQLVAQALERKYASDVPEAMHLVKLALTFDPLLTTAQHLSADLVAARSPDVAPASTTSASADRGKPHHGRDARAVDDGGPTRRQAPPATVDTRPPARATAPPSAPPSQVGGALLPPPPAPRPTSDTPPSTGPWL
jgi:hypothetical protein